MIRYMSARYVESYDTRYAISKRRCRRDIRYVDVDSDDTGAWLFVVEVTVLLMIYAALRCCRRYASDARDENHV